jgi:hypothetical protein
MGNWLMVCSELLSMLMLYQFCIEEYMKLHEVQNAIGEDLARVFTPLARDVDSQCRGRF